MKLADRMKQYEKVFSYHLLPNSYAIIRIDGKNFSKFTKRFHKPFDKNLMNAMEYTMKSMMENIQGAILGYHQSDEISILISDFGIDNTGHFGYKLFKILTNASSMATKYFNKYLVENGLLSHDDQWAEFDARCHNYPNHEIENYFLWRSRDYIRNSVSMVAHSTTGFSHIMQHKRPTPEIKKMLLDCFNVDWDYFSSREKYGTFCYKQDVTSMIDNSKSPKYGEYITRKKFVLETLNNEFRKGYIQNILDENFQY